MVRERAVRLEEAAHDLDLRQALEHPRQHRPGHPVRGVDDDPQGRDRRHVDEREHALDEAVPDVLGRDGAARRLPPVPANGTVADLVQPRLAPDRQRPAAHDLHPGVLLRVVRRGDHDAAVEPELFRWRNRPSRFRPSRDRPRRRRRRPRRRSAPRPSSATRAACRARPRSGAARTARRTRARSRRRRPRRAPTDRARARRTP